MNISAKVKYHSLENISPFIFGTEEVFVKNVKSFNTEVLYQGCQIIFWGENFGFLDLKINGNPVLYLGTEAIDVPT